MWCSPAPYKEDAEWLKEVELELETFNTQQNVEITQEDVTMQLRKTSNWKAPALDRIQGVWLKRFIFLIQKYTDKGNTVDNYGPKVCLNLL